jgi:hypothetical protein
VRGRDSSDPVSAQYPKPSAFQGGTIRYVGDQCGQDQYLDLEKEAWAALARD